MLARSLWVACCQVITNACATQAIIGILFNRPELSLGGELASFREFTEEFSPELKGGRPWAPHSCSHDAADGRGWRCGLPGGALLPGHVVHACLSPAAQMLGRPAGESLGHSELIRQVHNSFTAPHSFLSEEARAAKEEDDVYVRPQGSHTHLNPTHSLCTLRHQDHRLQPADLMRSPVCSTTAGRDPQLI